MPKMKTKSSAKKRFRITGNGKVKRGFAFKRHLLSHKTTNRKRRLRGSTNIHDSDLNSIAKLLPNS